MRWTRFLFPLLVLGGALFVAGALSQGIAATAGKEKAGRPAVKWEYKAITLLHDTIKIQDALNKVGTDGWECVGVTSTAFGGQERPRGGQVLVICKRPKQ